MSDQEKKLLSAACCLKKFYNNYMIYKDNTLNISCEDAFNNAKKQAEIAVNEYNLFIPDEVKNDLQLL